MGHSRLTSTNSSSSAGELGKRSCPRDDFVIPTTGEFYFAGLQPHVHVLLVVDNVDFGEGDLRVLPLLVGGRLPTRGKLRHESGGTYMIMMTTTGKLMIMMTTTGKLMIMNR